MKKLILAPAALILFFTNISRAQISFACMAIGGSSSEFGNTIIQTSDSGYAVAGSANSFGAANPDFCVTKLDAGGNLQWTKLISGSSSDVLTAIEQTSDGGYVAGGYTDITSYDIDCYIAKLDSNGNLEWDKHIGKFHWEYATSVHQTFDKGYVLAGQSNSTLSGDSDFYIAKLDTSGNLQWSKMIGGSGTDMAYASQQTVDSGYVLAGVTTSLGAGGNDVYVVKLDTAGDLEWAKAIGGSGNETANSIVQTSDSGYAVAGYTNSFGAGGNDVYVIKLDSGGNILWTRTFGGSNPDYATAIQQTADGGCIVGGHSLSFYGSYYRTYLVKLDAAGNLEWTSSAGIAGENVGNSMDQTFDGGYVIGGSSVAQGNNYYDFMVIKFDAAGNSCCPANPGASIDSGGVASSGGSVTDVTSTVSEIFAPDTLVEATITTFCIATSTSEEALPQPFTLFPNPAEDQFMISLEGTIHHGGIQLYNVMGEKILQEEFSNESTHEVNVLNISPGIYFLKLCAKMSGDTESFYSEKLIVR